VIAVSGMSPDDLVRGFIRDYSEWNDRAVAREGDGDCSIATSEYAAFIRKYCPDSIQLQGVSFGGLSMHHLDSEDIKATEISDDTAIVRTIMTEDVADMVFDRNYEYHFQRMSGMWKLIHVFYLSDGERFECL
jgi:hypothetical protein